MSAREQRLDAIQKASRNHPLVHFALAGLEDDAETFNPQETLEASLVEKLKALDDHDSLLAAVLGLFDLALVLQEKQGAFEAGEVILDALGQVTGQLEKAVEGLPDADGLVTALKARKKDGFGSPKADPAASGPVVIDPHAGKKHVGNAGFDLTAPPAPRKK
jgi:hypothetical protein